MAVLYLTAQKSSQNFLCCCLLVFICCRTSLLLLVSRRSHAFPRYSIYAHPYGQPTRGLEARPRVGKITRLPEFAESAFVMLGHVGNENGNFATLVLKGLAGIELKKARARRRPV